jgi:4-amino-4-deoxy-L-arabinose transferase-like glycosyltransferase
MLRRNWPFALVLAAGALLRLAAEVAYRPALFYSDSWGYLSMAHGSGLVTFAPLRPSGYPLILKVLHALPVITVAQHLAGLVTATLVYATARHLGVRRWVATVGGAFVALDAWAIALEQYILAEAFFGLALMLAVWASLAAATRPDASEPGGMRYRGHASLAIGFAGLCLAAAALMRPVGLFAVPAWIIWLVWVRPGWQQGARPLVAGLACLVVPLLAYSLAHQHTTGTFGLTQANGWFLYGRVGQIATCDGIDVERAARKLCDRPPQAAHENQSWFMFNRQSPARRAFGGISASSKKQARTDRILGKFARQVIAERPGDFANLVAADFLKYARPGPHAQHREDLTVEFPRTARIRFDDREIRHRLYPSLRTHASAPAGALRAYGKVFHTSRILVGLVLLVGIAALIIGLRRRDPLVRALFLTLGIGFGILLGAALGAGFALRYLVPAVAQFAIAATLCTELLASATRVWRTRRASPGGS